MSPRHTHARDAALRRLSRANRWMVAGSLALTAVFSEVAASAFPGKSVKASGATTSHKHAASNSKKSGATSALKAPTQAPQASTTPEVSPQQEAPPAEEPAATPEPRHEESAPSHESAPAEQSAPAQEPAPAPTPAPEPAPVHESAPPVVSGGS